MKSGYSRVLLALMVAVPLLGGTAVSAREIRFESGEPKYQLAPWGEPGYHRRITELDPTESVEVLYRFEWSVGAGDTQEERLETLEAALLQVNGMSGLSYPDSDRVLYHNVAVIDSPEFRQPAAAPRPLRGGDRREFYVLQDDDDFGDIVMRLTVYYGARIRIQVVNETRIKLGIIPAIKPEKMLLIFEVSPREDGLTVYGVGGLQTRSLGFLRGIIRNHLEVRVDAMVRWLRQELNRG